MKYKCPHCENELVVHWYSTKQNIRCSQCENLVFEKHLRKLRILSGSASALLFLIAFTILRANDVEVLGLIAVYVVAAGITLSILRIMEAKICMDLRVR